MLVFGLVEAGVDRVLFPAGREDVGPEEHPVGMSYDRFPRAPGLAAQLGNPRGDVHEHVRIRVQQALDSIQILGGAGGALHSLFRDPQSRARQELAGLQVHDSAVRVGLAHGTITYLSAQMTLRSAHI